MNGVASVAASLVSCDATYWDLPCDPFRALCTVACSSSQRTTRIHSTDGRQFHLRCVDSTLRTIAPAKTALVRVDNTPPRFGISGTFQNPAIRNSFAPDADPASGVDAGHIYYRAAGAGPWRPFPTQRRSVSFGRGSTPRWIRLGATSSWHAPLMWPATDGHDPALKRTADGLDVPAEVRRCSCRDTFRRIPSAHRGYGRPSKVSGILRDASGHPLADQDVTVTEYFGDGALIDTRVRTVRTDSDGRWKERLPGGPSRTSARPTRGPGAISPTPRPQARYA